MDITVPGFPTGLESWPFWLLMVAAPACVPLAAAFLVHGALKRRARSVGLSALMIAVAATLYLFSSSRDYWKIPGCRDEQGALKTDHIDELPLSTSKLFDGFGPISDQDI